MYYVTAWAGRMAGAALLPLPEITNLQRCKASTRPYSPSATHPGVAVAPHYVFRGPAMGFPAFGPGRTPPLVNHDPGGAVSPGPEALTDR